MLCLKVPRTEGEEVRKKLLDTGLLDTDYRIERENDHLLIPVKGVPEELEEYETLHRALDKRDKEIGDYRQLVELTDDLKDLLPSSYDIVGDIVLIKIPDELEEYRNEIGEALIRSHKKVKTVLEDKGVIGDFRVRDVEFVAGDEKTITLYREHGIELVIDVAESYFSPRLATERLRILDKVRKDDVILDMFAGVGPFGILLAKKGGVKRVHCIDINPRAIELLKENIELNGVGDRVKAHLGDAAEVGPSLDANRVIMNLPHSARDYIEHALASIRSSGTIHYYEILQRDDIHQRPKDIVEEIRNTGRRCVLSESRMVRTYSSSMVHMAYDFDID